MELIVKSFPDQINAKDYKYGGTPLHWAENNEVCNCFCNCIFSLYFHHLFCHLLSWTTLRYARLLIGEWGILTFSCTYFFFPQCIHKLAMLKCDMDLLNNEGRAALHVMLMKKRPECLMCLLCHGANCNILDANGESVLHSAIKVCVFDLLWYWLEKSL